MICAVHAFTANRPAFKLYKTEKMKCVPGVYKKSSKGDWKRDNFLKAVATWPYILHVSGVDVHRLDANVDHVEDFGDLKI